MVRRFETFNGDSRDVLKTLPDNSIDSVVTDPPYALVSIGKRYGKPGAAPASDGATGVYKRASAGFMGQAWDTGEVVEDPAFWAEVFRVLKPGGHLLAFSGTRTQHRQTMAIEVAGFEIRDMIADLIASDTHVAAFLDSLNEEQVRAFVRVIDESQFGGMLAWIYGSGFPKSHNVAKGIAKRRVEDVEPVRVICRQVRAAMDAAGLKSSDLVGHFGDCNPRLIDHWAARDTDSQPSLPTPEQWRTLSQVLGLPAVLDFEVDRLNTRKGSRGAAWSEAEVLGEADSASPGFGDDRFDGDRTIRALDGEAAAWEGWGTAIKPALEPVCVARKPLVGTVAANVLAHGTGALNIDGCRVDLNGAANPSTARRSGPPPINNVWKDERSAESYAAARPSEGLGRFPANVLHDGSAEVVEAFPAEAGAAAPVRGTEPSDLTAGILGERARVAGAFHGDSGSAARFFYSAKADAADRHGSGHPTVKPVDLMRWLCRLVTPPGGTVLDPFAGSGTTGQAAFLEGFGYVLIERDPGFFADMTTRLAWLRGQGGHTMQERRRRVKPEQATGADTPLFAPPPAPAERPRRAKVAK